MRHFTTHSHTSNVQGCGRLPVGTARYQNKWERLYVSRSVYGKAPKRQLHSTPSAVPGNAYTANKINSLKLSFVCKSAPQAILSRMQLALHATRRTLHGASRLVQAMSAWSVKTRHAPSRHCRDARVYGHTTTAMHEIEYIPGISYRVHPPPKYYKYDPNT